MAEKQKTSYPAVVAVGALGGSGTRVVAQLLIELGIYMGDDLNEANDNLFFTRLFKIPEWFANASVGEINTRLEIFQKYMTGKKMDDSEIKEVYRACESNTKYPSDKAYYEAFMKKQLNAGMGNINAWGWKEPNTQIFIEHIARYFPSLRYIQVIRHGLDMAFSENKQQLINWGSRFGIKIKSTDNENELAIKQLEYWIKSNQYVISVGKEMLQDRFYLLNHQLLCEQPATEIPKLIEFLGMQVDDEVMDKLTHIPTSHSSNARYKRKDLSIFTKEQIQAVIELGFEVEV